MKTAIAFSGGADSWALLFLNMERLDDVLVFWINTGKAMPETLTQIEAARAMCKNFIEVETSQEQQNARFGLPSEIVPINWTNTGQLVAGSKPVMIQSYLQCCYENISFPLHQACIAYDVEELILGQRNDESRKGTAVDGQSVEGVVRRFPIATWSRQNVVTYLADNMTIPDHFRSSHSSLDCFDCTAYRKDSESRFELLKAYPEMADAYNKRQSKVYQSIIESLGSV